MTVSMLSESAFLLWSFFFGICAALLYDAVRLVRICLGVRYGVAMFSPPALPLIGQAAACRLKKPCGKTNRFVSVLVTDLLYFFILGMLYAVFLYAAHDAVFRLYSLFALVSGFVIYRLVCNKMFLFFAPRSLFLLLAVQEYVKYLIFRPVFKIFRKIFDFFFLFFVKILLFFAAVCGILIMKINDSLSYRRRLAVLKRWKDKEN